MLPWHAPQMRKILRSPEEAKLDHQHRAGEIITAKLQILII